MCDKANIAGDTIKNDYNSYMAYYNNAMLENSIEERRIIGEFEVAKILSDSPSSLWKKTKDSAGITEQFFFEYFKGRKTAIAIEIAKPIRYKHEINPYKGEQKFTPPQSFRYIQKGTSAQTQLLY